MAICVSACSRVRMQMRALQMSLVPYAAVGLVVYAAAHGFAFAHRVSGGWLCAWCGDRYTVGYPAFVATVLWLGRQSCREDQLLRAEGLGDTRNTNPHCYEFRKRYQVRRRARRHAARGSRSVRV